MNQHHDSIRDATRQLAREVPPGRDLWPGIAARLDEPETTAAPTAEIVRPRFGRRTWGWLAAAAVLSVILLTPNLRRSATPADVTGLDRDFASIHDDVLSLVESRCMQLPATACAPLLDGLAVLDRTASGLSSALSTLPSDAPERPMLLARYRSTVDRAQDLRTRVERL